MGVEGLVDLVRGAARSILAAVRRLLGRGEPPLAL